MEKEKILQEFVKRVKEKYKEKIEKIILFGSYVRDEYHEDSDIDLLVITSASRFEIQKNLSGIAAILLETGVYISPKAVTTEKYEFMKKINTGFYQNIAREGLTIE